MCMLLIKHQNGQSATKCTAACLRLYIKLRRGKNNVPVIKLLPFLLWMHPLKCQPDVLYAVFHLCEVYLRSNTWGISSFHKSCNRVTLHHLDVLHTLVRHSVILDRVHQWSAAKQRFLVDCALHDAAGTQVCILGNAESCLESPAVQRKPGIQCVHSLVAAVDSWIHQNTLDTPSPPNITVIMKNNLLTDKSINFHTFIHMHQCATSYQMHL